MPAEDETGWTDEATRVYRELAPIAVPGRADQLTALLSLIPFEPVEAFRAVELASGEGLLAAALLRAFPQADLTALDGDAAMRELTSDRLRSFHDRAAGASFDLLETDWLEVLDGADVVVTSLAFHHAGDPGKRALFSEAGGRMSDRGAFLIADIVRPAGSPGWKLAAETYDLEALSLSRTRTGGDDLFKRLVAEEWNYFQHPEDPIDRPSRILDQLRWIEEAGFDPDVFWMRAGHAVYGGHRPGSAPGGLPWADAAVVVDDLLG